MYEAIHRQYSAKFGTCLQIYFHKEFIKAIEEWLLGQHA